MKRSMEADHPPFKLYSEGHHVPAGEVMPAVEAPKGESASDSVVDSGTNRPYKCKNNTCRHYSPFSDGFPDAWPHARQCFGDPRLD